MPMSTWQVHDWSQTEELANKLLLVLGDELDVVSFWHVNFVTDFLHLFDNICCCCVRFVFVIKVER